MTNKTAAAIRANWQTADSVVIPVGDTAVLTLTLEEARVLIVTPEADEESEHAFDLLEGNGWRACACFDLSAEIARAELAAEAKAKIDKLDTELDVAQMSMLLRYGEQGCFEMLMEEARP